ncbi:hypothetical protein LB456_03070 [Psychroflexus sp. CAK57W]|uniref:hypothetical protein n=1 Tax=Psychroflexus curvus TaxID=2873595 RepID=UPI001CCE56A6|nr:hypothetical protein [Psychroflexus curvus]MBZ9786428.1 hypothetical protein [Psychroflexus curvus]
MEDIMIKVFKKILGDLEHVSEINPNEYVSETEIYEFIIDKFDDNYDEETLNFYFMKLAAAAIAEEIDRQDQYSQPSFTVDQIFDLLKVQYPTEYFRLLQHYIASKPYIEIKTIDDKRYFLSENLKIEYDTLLHIYASFIQSDLKIALEKVKRILAKKAGIIEWTDLLIGGGGHYEDYEIVRIESIINGVID